jgi:N-acylglucosamine-6-phosphate 2-epimerase
MHPGLSKFNKGLIVSCQAYPGDPLYGAGIMAKMALAAKQGGAVGIRANGREDIASIKAAVDLPVIGIVKRTYPDSDIYITPTLREVQEIGEAGADMIALDATARPRPNGETLAELVAYIHDVLNLPVMGDVSTLEEAVQAQTLGIDVVAPTLAGYTPYTAMTDGPDWALLDAMLRELRIPVIAEGRIWTPEDARRAFRSGCRNVVVGTAITRPEWITERFAKGMAGEEAANG